ncbi:hypothetical protein PENSPDRAFT_586657 [Peniophora sp. CONT]|nr:hypothetical protein PENSPDRAFT_586657 [Peniophora sp. CONT]
MSKINSFYERELRAALEEQRFGVEDAFMIESTPNDAKASVVLLEGKTIEVKLSREGFARAAFLKRKAVYETIDDLLAAVSPMYKSRLHDTLLDKLNAIAARLDVADSRSRERNSISPSPSPSPDYSYSYTPTTGTPIRSLTPEIGSPPDLTTLDSVRDLKGAHPQQMRPALAARASTRTTYYSAVSEMD